VLGLSTSSELSPLLFVAGSSPQAIANANIIEKTVDDDIYFAFEYPFMNDVMRIVKEEEPEILEQSYDMDCLMKLRIRRSLMPKLHARLEKVESLRFIDLPNDLS
jgi:putative IMPACT (imprinted ancient) family translation regulator